MFRKILIANRGEIARRIQRTCSRLGVATVAVYSEADAGAAFVREADEAILIGPAPVRESYLRIDRILDAARHFGADAVHPGYGLLSENAEFAGAVVEAGLHFIGPDAALMERLGHKLRARAFAAELGIPTLPASGAVDPAPEACLAAARAVGFPLIVKLAGGGGGIGMVRVAAEDRLGKALATAARRGAASFGGSALYFERLVERGRHVEVQVLGGGRFGPHHVLGLRDCSTQRRHQKVIEEGPPPGLRPETSAALARDALKLSEAVAYVGVGTVEFLVEPDGRHWFLEMNTRIQVEHPVTEVLTGLDLVELQILAAMGQPWQGPPPPPSGHAIELRLYAEDPVNFLPQPGRVERLRWPDGPGIRIDTGIEEGSEVTPHYDPLLAKIIIHGVDRHAAIASARVALDALVLDGVVHNGPALRRVLSDTAFVAGDVHTSLLDDMKVAP